MNTESPEHHNERVRRELVRMRRTLKVLALGIVSAALVFAATVLHLHPPAR